MKKLFLIAMCVSMHIVCANAQSSSKATDNCDAVETEDGIVLTKKSWKDNWFISGGMGASLLEGTRDRHGDLGDRFGLNFDVAVGKWITPVVGLRLQYTAGLGRGYILSSEANETAYGSAFDGKNGINLYKQKLGYNYFHGDLMINLSNMIGGYKNRLYSAVPYAGFGLLHCTTVEKNNEVVGHVGLNNVFSVCSAIDLNLDLKAIVMGQSFDTEPGSKRLNGLCTGSVGVTYKFSPRGFKQNSTKPCVVDNSAELNRVNDLLAKANKQKEDLAKQLEAEKNKAPQVVEKVSSEHIYKGGIVDFVIGKSKLSKISRVNLGYIAEAIKAMPGDKVFDVIGYADNTTGSAEGNKALSKARAEEVYNLLVNEFGIDKSRLNVVYEGGVDTMFYNDPSLNRVVIIK